MDTLGTDLTTTPDLPYDILSNTPITVAYNIAPDPTLEPLFVFTGSLEEFNISFPVFAIASYLLEYLKKTSNMLLLHIGLR